MGNWDKSLKVRELIEILKTMHPDLPVVSQGCDCDGDVKSVITETYAGDTYAYLRRK